MATDTQPEVCLDVAVDHRIIRLFKPVSNDLTVRSNHVSCIEARGWSLKRPHCEIHVTTQLAGPAMKGGIAVALQQPRHNHPFKEGLNAVIQNCETLYALDEIFAVVSCGSLNIRTNIAVVDLLPYISEDIAEINDATLKESFHALTQTICDKEPYVLLCAGRVWLPKVGKFDNPKGHVQKFESIGVGKKFGSTPNSPVAARIRRGERGFIDIRRVNGFHPSHAMNHYPHVSLLRQLQILIGAETCGMLRGDWEEEEWMGELRRRCQNIPGAPAGKAKIFYSKLTLIFVATPHIDFILNKCHRPYLLNHGAQAKAQPGATMASFCHTTKGSTLMHCSAYKSVSIVSFRIQYWPRNRPKRSINPYSPAM